jgi:hypothetical protein
MEALASARSGGRSAVVARGETEAALARTMAGLGPPTAREVGVFYGLVEALRSLGRHTLPAGMPVLAESPRFRLRAAGCELQATGGPPGRGRVVS